MTWNCVIEILLLECTSLEICGSIRNASLASTSLMDIDNFTIIVRDKTFTLTKDQLEFDSPNYFTTYFLGEFKEGQDGKKSVVFNRHPALFELVVEYLTGYDIFPVPDHYIGSMTQDGLCKQIQEQMGKLQSQQGGQYSYELLVWSHDRRPSLSRLHLLPEAVPEYLAHFRRAELGLQSRWWIPESDRSRTLAFWESPKEALTQYAILRNPLRHRSSSKSVDKEI